jgi:hypothetical protein
MPLGTDYLGDSYLASTDSDAPLVPPYPSGGTLEPTTWHSVSQQSDVSAADFNQQLVVHTSSASYSDGTLVEFDVSAVNGLPMTFGGPYGSSASFGWVPIDGINTFAVAQALDGNIFGGGTRLRFPISFAQLTQNSNVNMKQFSSACDITVSFQGSMDSEFEIAVAPNGIESFSLTIPKEYINALASNAWPDANEFMASEFYTLPSSMVPVTTLATTTTADYTLTAAFTGNIGVIDNSGFPISGGSFTITAGTNIVTMIYTGVDASNNLTGCHVQFGDIADPGGTVYASGSPVTITASLQTQYINAGIYIVAQNILTSNSTTATAAAVANGTATIANTTYYATYLAGTIGPWTTGDSLPEFNCSIAYAPASETIYAMGPSGAMYSVSLPQDGTVMGTWGIVQPTIPTDVTFNFPAYNLLPNDAVPSIAVCTIDSIDYVFIIGGISNGIQQFTCYYTYIATATGALVDFVQTATVSFATSQGTATTSAGLYSFCQNNCIYARDTTNLVFLTLYSIPVWIDSAGNINTGTWTCVISQYSNAFSTLNIAVPAQPAVTPFAAPITLPVTITSGTNDQFVYTPISTGVPDTFTVAGGTYATLSLLAAVYGNALDSSSTPFGDIANVSTSNPTNFVEAIVGSAFNGDTISEGNGALALLGFSNTIAFENGADASTVTVSTADVNQLILGVGYNNVVTNTSIIGLTPDGYGISDNISSLPPFYTGALAYNGLVNAAVFENDDGTCSILSSYGFAAWLFPATWIDIPLPSVVSNNWLVIAASGTPRTNFGVNIGISNPTVYTPDIALAPEENYIFYPMAELLVNGWHQVDPSTMINMTLYAPSHVAYPSFVGLFEDNITRWNVAKYSSPNDLLLYLADITYDSMGINTTTSVVALEYDGLGGFNLQPQVIPLSVTELTS